MSALMEKVAKLANVNKSTVSRVFNNHPNLSEETRQKVLDAAQKLNYFPNKRVYQNQAKSCIGILIDKTFIEKSETMTPIYSSDLFFALTNAINSEDCYMLSEIFDFGKAILSRPKFLQENRVSGLILMGISSPESFVQVKSWKIPCCSLGVFENMPNDFFGVIDDCALGMFKAVSHLIGLGHSRIALVNGSEKYVANRDKKSGYLQAFEQFQLPCRKEYIRTSDDTISPFEFGYHATRELIGLQEAPTAIAYMTDYTSLGGVTAIREKGLKIPDDISIFGFDDSFLSLQVSPRLSSVNLNVEELARVVVDVTTRQMRKLPLNETRYVIEPQIVVRESCSRVMA